MYVHGLMDISYWHLYILEEDKTLNNNSIITLFITYWHSSFHLLRDL